MERLDSGYSDNELCEAMRAADEAMLELGPTMAALNRNGASEEQKNEFLKVYGTALHRRGQIKQQLIAAGIDPDDCLHLQTQDSMADAVASEMPAPSVPERYPADQRRRSAGKLLRWLAPIQ